MCRETRHGEATIDSRVLEEAVKNALNDYLPRLEATANTRTRFFNKFQREADEHDKDFVGKYNSDLDTTLIFAGLFSAVTSAFIIAVQTQLQPDYNQLNYDILWAFADSTGLNSTGRIPPKPSSDSPWAGPDHTLVHVQAILFSSLAASLLAAFVAVLGKQWLNRYSQVDMHGSLYDRSRDRQRKIDGMDSWGFRLVMECLPLMLQIALLLLGCALSKYLFAIDHLVAWVVFGFTAFGLLFYVIIVVAATISYNCPFQTPLPLIIRFIIRFDRKNTKYLKRSRDWFRGFFSRMKLFQQKTPILSPWSCCGNNGDGHDEIPMNGLFNPRLSLFGENVNQGDFVLDANCIAWMFEVSMDADVILDIMRFIPEVVWHADVRTTPLEKLYDTVLECIDRSSGNPVLIPKFREKAYSSAKALVHIATQRRFMGAESDREKIDSISRQHQIIRSRHYEGDSDLESVLGMVDCVFGPNNLKPMDWHKLFFSAPHHTWMGQIVFYRAWDALGGRGPLPDDVRGFVLHTLGSDSPPPAVVTVCLVIIGLVLELRLQNNGPHVTDGSGIPDSQIARIYDELAETFRNANAITLRVCRALEAMELIVSLPRDDVAARSYELFRIAARASVSPTHAEEIKWKVCRLALRGVYKPEITSPPVEDSLEIFNFLDHHFDSATGGDGKYDEPIQNALFALASASDHLMNNALTHFDPTKPSFVNGIRRVLQDHKPLRLRKAVLSFLPRIANIWFDPARIIMKPNEMERFCKDWASAIDKIGVTDTTRASLAVLFCMINSPHWRPHIVASKWGLLEYFIADTDESGPFGSCLENPEVVDGISKAGDEYAAGLWSKILLLRYGRLREEVRSRFKEKMRDVLRKDLEGYRSMIDSKRKEAENGLTRYGAWPKDPEAKSLKKEKESHEEAMKFLESLKGGRRF